jgi:hypothetical protein
MKPIGLLTEDGAILDERLSNLLDAYSDVEPEAAPPGYQHAAVAHGPFIPLMVQAGAAIAPLPDMPNLQIEITISARSPARRAAGEVDEVDEAYFYERLERLLQEHAD